MLLKLLAACIWSLFCCWFSVAVFVWNYITSKKEFNVLKLYSNSGISVKSEITNPQTWTSNGITYYGCDVEFITYDYQTVNVRKYQITKTGIYFICTLVLQ